jgi:hypothetical protein
MPTLDDLFGSKNYGPKTVNLKQVGDFVKGVVTEIITDAPVFDWDNANKRPGLQKFWVDNKPKGVAPDEAARAGLNPVHQIMIVLSPVVGQGDWFKEGIETVQVPINSKGEREAFKAAVEEFGGSIDIGDTFGKRLTERDGNMKTHVMKVEKA